MPIVAIPGMPGESIDKAILPDVVWIMRTYKVRVTDGYAPTGHEASGDHPKGAGVDIVPDTARGGTWDDVDRLAAFAKAHPGTFRWIGYDGVPGHGRGNHLHLSWHGYGTAGDNRPVHLVAQDQIAAQVRGQLSPADLAGDVAKPAVDLAGDVAKAGVGLLVDAIGRDGARFLLSAALVLAGAGAVAFGAARALGVRTPPIPIPAVAAAKALKGAT